MDVRVCEAKKYLNELKYESEVKQSRLQELQEMLAQLNVSAESEADREGERVRPVLLFLCCIIQNHLWEGNF